MSVEAEPRAWLAFLHRHFQPYLFGGGVARGFSLNLDRWGSQRQEPSCLHPRSTGMWLYFFFNIFLGWRDQTWLLKLTWQVLAKPPPQPKIFSLKSSPPATFLGPSRMRE